VTLSGAYKESRKRGGARIVSGHPGSAIVNISIPLDTAQGRGTVQYIRYSIPLYQTQDAQYHQTLYWALIMHKRHITVRHTRMDTVPSSISQYRQIQEERNHQITPGAEYHQRQRS
jgi:hypothetical protein